MDSHFGFENASPCYTTERSLDFAPLLARANLAKLSIQLLKLSFFSFFFFLVLLITLITSPTGSILPPVNKCKTVSNTSIQACFGVHQDGPGDKFIGGA